MTKKCKKYEKFCCSNNHMDTGIHVVISIYRENNLY